MRNDKYNRAVSLLCPVCGYDQFKNDDADVRECVNCGRRLGTEELIEENAEVLDGHLREIGREAVKDLTKEFRGALKRSLRGNKHIKLR
jgi:hypothetical protein